MSNLLIASLDSQSNYKIGENGQAEYDVRRNTHLAKSEQILQFSFQLVRTPNLYALQEIFIKLLRQVDSKSDEFILLAKLVANTRDIVDGKGEYALAYMLVYTLYWFHPELSMYLLKTFVQLEDGSHPFGSWKDIKYFCKYCKEESLNSDHPLINYAISLMIEQLKRDVIEPPSNASLAGRWCPRENKKHGWVFDKMAKIYFSDYIKTAKSLEQIDKAVLKGKMNFRKIISGLNKKLDTIQIKQCSEKWSEIDHARTTSITLKKQTKALLNLKKDGSTRSHKEDRIECAENFSEFFKEGKVKGKRVAMNDFTKSALELISRGQQYSVEADVLNEQWKDSMSLQTASTSNIIPLVDVSASMHGDPLFCAIALGIRLAEQSIFGKRVLTFSEIPHWHTLDGCDEFVAAVQSLSKANWGGTTNFYMALDRILTCIVDKKLKPKDTEGLVLAIFSDMQINAAMPAGQQTNTAFKLMYRDIEEKFTQVGMKLYGEPFPVPHILFWNLRSTLGSPCESSIKNVTMFSGFSPALLNGFCKNGIEALKNATPWETLKTTLNNPRYDCIEHFIQN
jgi:hypothetical protein